jgi:hypothetical protein
MVRLRVVEVLAPMEFVCKKSLNHKYPLRVHVTKGVSVSKSVTEEVDEDADPVGVVAVDGEAQMVIREGIDATTS